MCIRDRASFVQVNPLRDHVARAVLFPEPAPGTVEECRPVLGRRLRPPLGRCCEQVFHDLDPIPSERFSALRLRVIEDSTDSRDRRPGATFGDIGHAIQRHAEASGYSVVREFCGHGIGRRFHEEPQVLHYGRPGTGERLEPGMIFTVEPMINAGRREVRELADGWTIVTKDHSLSAQWEHTVLVTDAGQTIVSGALPLALGLAALAGLVSFASPCVLPLVPGYLGFVSGMAAGDRASSRRWRTAVGALLFVAGFTAVFVLMALFVTSVGRGLWEHKDLLMRLGGGLVIVLGLVWVMLIPLTQVSTRPRRLSVGRRAVGAVLVTALAFGVAAPSAIGARYARDQMLLVDKVFTTGVDEVKSSTRPTLEASQDTDPFLSLIHISEPTRPY